VPSALETATGVTGTTADTGDTAVTVPEVPGTNLVVSAHDHEVLLVDMDGETLHRWQIDPAEHGVETGRSGFRRAWLLDDGDLLALIEYESMWRLGPDSSVRWVVQDGNHHHVHIGADGTLTGLTWVEGPLPGRDDGSVWQDVVTTYRSDGTRVRDVNLVEALMASDQPELSVAVRAAGGSDPLHAHSVFVLDEDLPHDGFDEGNVLVSARAVSHLLVVDPEESLITWAASGSFVQQHEATVLSPDRVLVFDNGTRPTGSRALELSLPDLEEVWSASVDGAFTSCCGTASRLGDGHTMMVSTKQGKAWELDPDGEVVWSYTSPFVGSDGSPAFLYDVRRTPPETELPWLRR